MSGHWQGMTYMYVRQPITYMCGREGLPYMFVRALGMARHQLHVCQSIGHGKASVTCMSDHWAWQGMSYMYARALGMARHQLHVCQHWAWQGMSYMYVRALSMARHDLHVRQSIGHFSCFHSHISCLLGLALTYAMPDLSAWQGVIRDT
eukprot:575817-Amorphochlora_amoeboformis.AAC.1